MTVRAGKEIPWSFGWFKVQLSHGPCHGVRRRSDCRDEVWQIMDGWLLCLYETTKRGIVVRDISSRNILIRWGAPQPVEFTEFASGRNSDAIEPGETAKLYASEGGENCLRTVVVVSRLASDLPQTLSRNGFGSFRREGLDESSALMLAFGVVFGGPLERSLEILPTS
ncbi:hypothetical protein SCP_0702210 [Sparassis crispa]|uniref:Protein kinase domain-containing protein n=1 Tax=Sparassis crispa TaxID=139825 RepID=A0A401GS36_9APHY|nr:hypothetical protein SCP_0702210 [Sparassis crispa]GBE85035.1 hypothetical protein SCP_0702210 [Sparassis crispa]